jgi:serine protease Do
MLSGKKLKKSIICAISLICVAATTATFAGCSFLTSTTTGSVSQSTQKTDSDTNNNSNNNNSNNSNNSSNSSNNNSSSNSDSTDGDTITDSNSTNDTSSSSQTQGGNVITYVSTNSTVLSTTAEVVKAVADSVVEISTEYVTTQWGHQYIVSGAGSGVVVGKVENSDNYYIVTNNHVIEDAEEITVRMRSGDEYKATLVATDDSADIAVITITSENELTMATWGNSDDLQVGEDLIAIGNPLGSLGGTVTKGILSATSRMITIGDYSMTLLQTDTAINPGNSGGGLFNMRGELIGIVNAKTSSEEIEGICFAIPGNTALVVYEDLVQYGYIVGRSTFNLELAEGTISSGINTAAQGVVYVTAVNSSDSVFSVYDRIYSINGEVIDSLLTYNTVMAGISAGDEVTVEVYHGHVTQGFWSSSISFDENRTTLTATAEQYGA